MNALVPVNTAPAMTVSDVERVANAIAKGGLFGSKDPYAVLTLCLVAQAEGQHPAVVFRDYHIINGKPAKKAEAMLRDFLSAGGKVEWHALTDELADATFAHPSGGTARISWDHARAVKAQIAGNAMYKKYPRQMLRSRTISEGVRTVYPGATSGLYEEGEVASFADPAPRAAGIEGDGHDTQREPIDISALDVSDAPEREKVPGITKIKNNLNKFMREGNKCTDLEAFRKLVHDNRADLKTIREAGHSYWTGDGEDHEGYEKWMERRYAELTPKEDSTEYQFLASCVNESTTTDELQKFMWAHGDKIGDLDGEESRKFETLYDQRAAQLKELTPMTAGQFGG